MRRLALAVALGVLAIGVAAAAAAVVAIPGKPPAGKVLLGMVGPDPDGFDRLTRGAEDAWLIGLSKQLHDAGGPGRGYVDIVANDLYSDSGEPSWQGMDKLYAYGKPYLVAEWALEAEDDVEFARRMFAWVAAHPRTIGLVYFNKGWSGGSGIYELRSKPRGLVFYRGQVRHPRYLASVP